MIAMQYSIALPADYDMAIVRRRIADQRHLLDDCPGLAFKAWLHAARDDRDLPSRANLSAPFHPWPTLRPAPDGKALQTHRLGHVSQPGRSH